MFTSSLQCTDLGNTGRRFSVTATLELEKVGSVASFDQWASCASAPATPRRWGAA